MARTLFLHLGPAKTGTSAIQHILSRHDGSVVLYPRVGLWPDGSHHNLVLNFYGNYQRPDVVREDPARLLEQIGREARATDRDVVISSEILAGHRDIETFVTALQAAIGGNCRVTILVVAREHRERAASLYNQRVKDAVVGETREPDTFLIDQPQRLCYNVMLRRLKKTPFDLRVLNYHPAEDFAVRCLELFGFPPDRIVPAPKRNASLGRLALVATLAANRAMQSREERARFDAVLSRACGRFVPADALFSLNAAAAVRDTFLADRKFLRQRFDVNLPKREKPPEASPFVISEAEFGRLAEATQELGDYGARVLEQLRAFVDNP